MLVDAKIESSLAFNCNSANALPVRLELFISPVASPISRMVKRSLSEKVLNQVLNGVYIASN